MTQSEDSQIQNAIGRWVQHLNSTVHAGMFEQEITKRMMPLSRDNAWVHYGGSGRRSRLFLIDDGVQVRFDFDVRDQLSSYSVYKRTKRWLKGPDGILLDGFDAPDAEVQFPSEP